ncbi:anthranilate phosphoribosyltransferase [Paenibacillus allorhizosphaerae]|uniref:Anthranilate phosphoribosyltransferase n=1 Tax=Paenibacillus allorhizosphaerae TaxID=2849866 RepID=A0ABM8VDK7_9BACL|nr:anthranilate phosphoribosyltransferase [Paenibacillus allorhizosphaerae]CAG7628133.1 Anthranilate phosphoribosyltransferase [Paenibacillus allorhizosphaerae]
MKDLLKEVGRGKRGARDLSYEEARQAAEWIVSRKATDAQIGAFLLAERIKMESAEELRAFIDVLRSRSRIHPVRDSIDCAGPYDGRTRSFMATFPSAFVLASCGLPVTLHSSPALPPKRGVTVADVIKELGIPFDVQTERWVEAAKAGGVLFVPTEQWCPPLGSLRRLREELDLRTVFNTAEKLLRFSDCAYMAVGVFHGTAFEKMARLVMSLGVRRSLIIQGVEGSEDLPIDKRSRAYVIDSGRTELMLLNPELYEMQVETADAEWTAANQAEAAIGVLRGEAELPCLNAVLFNSAIRLWIGEKVDSIEEGIYRARNAIDSGAAKRKFDAWKRAVSPAVV